MSGARLKKALHDFSTWDTNECAYIGCHKPPYKHIIWKGNENWICCAVFSVAQKNGCY